MSHQMNVHESSVRKGFLVIGAILIGFTMDTLAAPVPQSMGSYYHTRADLYLAETIKEGRIAKNLTVEQVAEKLFTSPEGVLAWEAGKDSPSSHILPLLEKVLGVDVKP